MRIEYRTVHAQLFERMRSLQAAIDSSGLEPSLLEILRLRASQINGCSFCVELHIRQARELGVPEEKLDLVAVWRTAAGFSAPERTCLAWCEAVTRLEGSRDLDLLAQELQRHFSDEQVVAITWAVAAINTWNRVAVPLGRRGGSDSGPAHPNRS